MDDAEDASLLSPASPNTHLQNKIVPVLAKGPVQLCSCWAGEMLNWGKEAGQELGGAARRHREFLPTAEEMLTDTGLYCPTYPTPLGANGCFSAQFLPLTVFSFF